MSYYTPTEEEVLTMLKKPDAETLRGMRDQAMLELLYSSGLRRQELVNLDVHNINLRERTVRVIKGKNAKDRLIPMTKKACEALKTYLEAARPLYDKYPENKALFLGEHGRRVSACRIDEIVHEYAGFNPKIAVHSLRHAVASHMLKRGANILYLQKLLGHSSPKTTQVYTRLYPKNLMQIYDRFHPRKYSNQHKIFAVKFPK